MKKKRIGLFSNTVWRYLPPGMVFTGGLGIKVPIIKESRGRAPVGAL